MCRGTSRFGILGKVESVLFSHRRFFVQGGSEMEEGIKTTFLTDPVIFFALTTELIWAIVGFEPRTSERVCCALTTELFLAIWVRVRDSNLRSLERILFRSNY